MKCPKKHKNWLKHRTAGCGPNCPICIKENRICKYCVHADWDNYFTVDSHFKADGSFEIMYPAAMCNVTGHLQKEKESCVKFSKDPKDRLPPRKDVGSR